MPIDTNSEGWINAEEPGSMSANILRLLSNNPDKAYTIREIAEEVSDVEWSAYRRNSELREEYQDGHLDRGEYEEQKEDISGWGLVIQTFYVRVRIRPLIEEALVESRAVDASEVDTSRDVEEILHYTYCLDGAT